VNQPKSKGKWGEVAKFTCLILYFIFSYMKKLLVCLSLAFLGACSPDEQNAASTWPTFGHDVSNNRFSALTGIDTFDVRQLQEV
jgi:hypothetical protein